MEGVLSLRGCLTWRSEVDIPLGQVRGVSPLGPGRCPLLPSGAWFTLRRAVLLSSALEGCTSVHSGGVASLSFGYLV